MASSELFLGIDGGGSKCKARLENRHGELLGEGLSGPANPAQNAELAFQSILEASAEALRNAGFGSDKLAQVNAVMGLAGVNIPEYYQCAEQWQHPFRRRLLTTDLHIACLGAHGGHEGAILITGTGSSAFASVHGQQISLGGYGFPLGDKGSGAWLGWRLLGVVLDSFDGLLDGGELVDEVCERLQLQRAEELSAKALHYQSSQYAQLAPIVIAAAARNNPLARTIMAEGAAYLTQLLYRLQQLQPARISVIGGLASRWIEWFPDDIKGLLKSPLCSPEYGATALARQQFKEC